MIYLNDKWALDGRDPNSYSSIGLILGKFDRQYREQPIFGTVRGHSSETIKRKYKTETYLATYSPNSNGTLYKSSPKISGASS